MINCFWVDLNSVGVEKGNIKGLKCIVPYCVDLSLVRVQCYHSMCTLGSVVRGDYLARQVYYI